MRRERGKSKREVVSKVSSTISVANHRKCVGDPDKRLVQINELEQVGVVEVYHELQSRSSSGAFDGTLEDVAPVDHLAVSLRYFNIRVLGRFAFDLLS